MTRALWSSAPVRPITPADAAALLALNNAHATETSHLDPADWGALTQTAFAALCVDRAGFVVVFDQNAAYDSPNFQWFRARYDRFAYVDRIVVDQEARGLGLARKLYEAVFAVAQAAGHARLACEVNQHPPNPGSDAFHAAMGFEAVGEGHPHGDAKRVRYLLRPLPALA
ncbi:MAG: GNAT family N-acetyltransferase [Pseudomonadota bacterium]